MCTAKFKSYKVANETTIDAAKFKCNLIINIGFDNPKFDEFSKTIESISDNSQTGYEVDTQRENEITEYIATLNA